jgi:hypothetical protein
MTQLRNTRIDLIRSCRVIVYPVHPVVGDGRGVCDVAPDYVRLSLFSARIPLKICPCHLAE